MLFVIQYIRENFVLVVYSLTVDHVTGLSLNLLAVM